MKTHIETGFIHPRDYGVVVGSRYDKFFFSPFKYALAKLMLETSEEINARLEKFADINSYNKKETKVEFRKGVKRKEKLTRLIDMDANELLFDVKKYGKTGFTAKAQSKSDKNIFPYKLSLDGPSIINVYDEFQPKGRICDCNDSYWVDVKRRTIACMHTSALELALSIDNKTRKSSEENLTKLLPMQRDEIILPFQIGVNNKLDDLLTDALWQYYVEKKDQFEINKSLLENSEIYSQSLLKTLNNPNLDRARYEVLRHAEQKKSKNQILESERRFYAASNALEKRITEKLDLQGFKFRGYSLEFKGTEDEIIAKRFANRNEVISICVPNEMPPIMIQKYLGSKTEELSFGYSAKPLIFGNSLYEDIDDVTRRNVVMRVFVPGEKKGSDIFVPEILKERYAKLKQI